MYDTVIIGAGMSGLAAGIRLAYHGLRVCILERHTTIGGLNSFYRLAGRNYDVGLHALTNYVLPGKRGPLTRVLRQLRLKWDDFALAPQVGSEIAFPGVRLKFNNDPELLRAQVVERFPETRDRWPAMVAKLPDYDAALGPGCRQSARQVLREQLREPLLEEMLLCPAMFYGGSQEHDMDWGQFAILFRSIFLEGLSRPFGGIRVILKHLVRRFREVGGELRLRAGVARISGDCDHAAGVVLDGGDELSAKVILSSAGWRETQRLCDAPEPGPTDAAGRLSFFESVSSLSAEPRQLGFDQTVVFFNDSQRFRWSVPDEAVDLRSGVVCSPNNYAYDEPLGEGVLRVTSLANYEQWRSLRGDENAYRDAKQLWYQRLMAAAARFVPDLRNYVVATDTFTPTTIQHYTGHENGAVYGTAHKRWDGTTHLKNLFLCGTDQGLVGIVGALTSGIAMANRHVLSALAGHRKPSA